MTATQLVCALIAGLAVAYAVEEGRRVFSGRLFALVTRGQAIRRVIGASSVAVMMVLVYLGLEGIDPYARPMLFFGVWLAVSGLTAFLLLLGWLDWRELKANQEIARARQLWNLGQSVSNGPAPRETDDAEE